MSSYFEELGAFDRPFIDKVVKVGPTDVKVSIRQISAAEQDAVDAFEMNEYGRLVQEANVSTDGAPSEFARVLSVYKTRSVSEIARQLLATRNSAIRDEAAKLANIDLNAEELKMIDMTPAERDAYVVEMDAKLQAVQKVAEDKITDEIAASDSFDNLCVRLAEINTNFKCQMKARRASNTHFLYNAMFRPDDHSKRVFETPDSVRALAQDTIDGFSTVVREALRGDSDLPKPSPEEPASDKPSPSPDTSEVEAPTSGDSTTGTPAS